MSINGLVSFDRKLKTFSPSFFPGHAHVSVVAPFWADVDTEHSGGQVFYQIYDDPQNSYIERATEDVRGHGGQEYSSFSAKWVLVVTWSEVANYPSQLGTERNTFQLVVVSDGVVTFALLNYLQDGLEWFGRVAAAAVGFTSDDAAYFVNHFLSRTPHVVNLAGHRLFYKLSLPTNPCATSSRCLTWYNEDIDAHGCSYPFWTAFLEPCPCTHFQASHDGRFRVYKWRYGLICFVSSFARPFGVQTECCYQWLVTLGGALVEGPVLGGSSNRYSSVVNPQLHQQLDVQPYEDCCIHTNLCHLYYERRPSTSCQGYVPPSLGTLTLSATMYIPVSSFLCLCLLIWNITVCCDGIPYTRLSLVRLFF